MKNNKVLFIIKERLDSYGQTIGLKNSINFTCLALRAKGYNADWAHVVDQNRIDKEVHCHRPRMAVIEALWVTPAKLQELMRLHRHVTWVIRFHSKIPFFSGEGVAIEWIKSYLALPHQNRLVLSFNNQDTNTDFEQVLESPFRFLPNLYNRPDYSAPGWQPDGKLHIGCFGAIRPLKNQLIQAMATLVAAKRLAVKLHYHINASRCEQKGEAILKNIINLFAGTRHELVLHGWMKHEDFLRLASKMDIGLQVSYSESFNIVAADFVYSKIPIVVSKEIDWMPNVCQVADPNDMLAIADHIELLLNNRALAVQRSERNLADYNRKGYKAWSAFLEEHL